MSEYRSKIRKNAHIDSLYEMAGRIAESGYVAELQKQEILQGLQKIGEAEQGDFAPMKVESLIHNVLSSKHVLDNGNNVLTQDVVDAYRRAFEIIYREANDKMEAEAIIARILSEVNT